MMHNEFNMDVITNEVLEEIGQEQIKTHGLNSSLIKLKTVSAKSGIAVSANAVFPLGGINTASVTILKGFGFSVSTLNPLVASTIVISGFMLAGYGLYKMNEKVMARIL
ncbi:MAG: hypothetical protein HQL46_07540 [Gammaproteobacteria bacterium]|nr:hypothetical protein [Gammaproteobacteria bacterium]